MKSENSLFTKEFRVDDGKNLDILLEEMRFLKNGDVLKVNTPNSRIVLTNADYIQTLQRAMALEGLMSENFKREESTTLKYMSKQDLLDFYEALTGNRIDLNEIRDYDRFGKLFNRMGL